MKQHKKTTNITPTHQRFRQNCDTIILLAADSILEKLCFGVIKNG